MSKQEEHGAPTISILFSPKESGGKEFTFPKTEKVGEAATEAALAFGYAAGSTVSFRNADKKVLEFLLVCCNERLSFICFAVPPRVLAGKYALISVLKNLDFFRNS